MSQLVQELEPTEFQKTHHSPLQIEVDRQIRARVLDGMELLKEKYGEDWVDHIDLESLDLMSAKSCVLGQLYGNWDRGRELLGIKHVDGKYGFSFDGLELPDHSSEQQWTQLQATWIQELAYARGLA